MMDYVIGGIGDPAMEPVDIGSLPELDGTEKQIAWAKDIRASWVKKIELTQEKYKEGVDALDRYKITNPEKYQSQKEFRERLAENRRKHIAAARVALNSTASAKVIIGARNAFDDVVCDIVDAMDNGESDDKIKKIIFDYR